MSQDALGLIEVIGLTTAIEAADTCIKASNVQLIGYEKVTSGLVTVKVQGDVGAVKAAIEAAKVCAGKVGVIVSTIIIPRPALGVQPIIFSTQGNKRTDQEDQLIKEQTVNQTILSKEHSNYNQEKSISIKDKIVPNSAALNKMEQIIEKDDSKKIKNTMKDTIDEVSNLSSTDELIQVVDLSIVQEENVEKAPPKGLKMITSTCNLCDDENCTREKGQPRTLCLHHQEGKTKKDDNK